MIMMVTAIILAAACSSDKELPQYASGLDVVRAQTAFGVVGGTQEVIMASQPAMAYAQDEWLKVTTKAETILLTAETNTNPQSRNTLLVVKNQQGDSILINVQQEGISFGLPTGEDIYTGDEPIEKKLIALSNVAVDYSTTGNWITVEQKGEVITVKVAENNTGKPRVGWVMAKAVGLTDSLKVVQASLADVEGEYQQTAMMRKPDRNLEERTSDVRIVATSKTTANFIVDNQYVWPVTFTPGKGFDMKNGKIVGKNEVQTGVFEYLITVIVADDFRKGHETAINGTQESVLLAINDKGELVFKEAQKIASEQTFSSYGWNRYSDTKPVLGAFRGIGEVFVQPKLTRKP